MVDGYLACTVRSSWRCSAPVETGKNYNLPLKGLPWFKIRPDTDLGKLTGSIPAGLRILTGILSREHLVDGKNWYEH